MHLWVEQNRGEYGFILLLNLILSFWCPRCWQSGIWLALIVSTFEQHTVYINLMYPKFVNKLFQEDTAYSHRVGFIWNQNLSEDDWMGCLWSWPQPFWKLAGSSWMCCLFQREPNNCNDWLVANASLDLHVMPQQCETKLVSRIRRRGQSVVAVCGSSMLQRSFYIVKIPICFF